MLLQGKLDPATFLQAAHQHLVSRCDPCRVEWEAARDLEGSDHLPFAAPRPSPAPGPSPDLPESRYHLSVEEIDARVELLSELRLERRLARKDLNILLDVPPSERGARIDIARSRFQSPALAEMLVEESRRRVRDDPGEAEELAALADRVLHRSPGGPATPHGRALLARALAHRANALRVGGDLAAADRWFATLQRDLDRRPLGNDEVMAEVWSLMASLRIEQRQLSQAQTLLAHASAAYGMVKHSTALMKTKIKMAGLYVDIGEPERALSLLRAVRDHLDRDGQARLFFCALNTEVWALAELHRFDEAEEILDRHDHLWERDDNPKDRATLLQLRGRIAAGRGRFAEARDLLERSCHLLLDLGLVHLAADLALDLALLLLDAGRTAELEDLATDLVAVFRAHGVERETLAGLALLARAARAETVSRELLQRVRERVAPPQAG